jgi:CRISPR type III-A-associated RAMP protein Csm5
MNNVKIETLTPVHIGSGNFLYNNMDFTCAMIDDTSYAVVISEDKIWQLLGEQHLDNWLNAIAQKEDLKAFLQKYAPQALPADYAKRLIYLCSSVKKDANIKELLHDGMGLPYIPGSSIKGAIRTAILAMIARNNANEEAIILKDKNGRPKKDRKTGDILVSAESVEKRLFGKDPNNDIFRFIQVGDAYFAAGSEVALRLVNLNITHSDELMDESKQQLIEAIGEEEEASFQMKIAEDFYRFAKANSVTLGDLPVHSLNDLFLMINEHTRKLVEAEIDYWTETDKAGAEDYVENMKAILDEVNACSKGYSCVLRIGHASGWRFITGAWTEELSNFKDVVVPAARPNNRNYSEYDFPKSRRIGDDGGLLGFVRLTQF